jgi:hypothetical protein
MCSSATLVTEPRPSHRRLPKERAARCRPQEMLHRPHSRVWCFTAKAPRERLSNRKLTKGAAVCVSQSAWKRTLPPRQIPVSVRRRVAAAPARAWDCHAPSSCRPDERRVYRSRPLAGPAMPPPGRNNPDRDNRLFLLTAVRWQYNSPCGTASDLCDPLSIAPHRGVLRLVEPRIRLRHFPGPANSIATPSTTYSYVWGVCCRMVSSWMRVLRPPLARGR